MPKTRDERMGPPVAASLPFIGLFTCPADGLLRFLSTIPRALALPLDLGPADRNCIGIGGFAWAWACGLLFGG